VITIWTFTWELQMINPNRLHSSSASIAAADHNQHGGSDEHHPDSPRGSHSDYIAMSLASTWKDAVPRQEQAANYPHHTCVNSHQQPGLSSHRTFQKHIFDLHLRIGYELHVHAV
jgi:hypothetical protein